MSKVFVRHGLVFVFATAVPVFAHAGITDVFKPYVHLSSSYDDNLFRLDSRLNPIVVGGKKKTSDIMNTVGAGINMDWHLSQQHLTGNIEFSNNTFKHNSQMNYVGQKANINWNWLYGRKWDGVIGFRHEKSLSSFSDSSVFTVGIKGSTKNTDSFYASGWYKLDTRLKTGVRVSNYQTRYGNVRNKKSNSDTKIADVLLRYGSSKHNYIGGKISYSGTLFPNRTFTSSSTLESQYSVTKLYLDASWRVSGKNNFKLGVGWQFLKNKHLSNKDFNDWGANITNTWSFSDKVFNQTKLWNEIYPSSLNNSTYQRARGISIQPVWSVTDRNSFIFSASYEEDTYDASVDSGQSLKDKLTNMGMTWQYLPWDKITFALGYQYSERLSNKNLRNYKSNMVFADIKASW